jgi:hypothetical protein
MTTFKQLTEQCRQLNELTGRCFKAKNRNGVVCLHDEQGSCYSPWMSNKDLSQWMDALRRGFHIGISGLAIREVGTALESVCDLVERTYAHDQDGERLDEPGELSGADVTEELMGMELALFEARDIVRGQSQH